MNFELGVAASRAARSDVHIIPVLLGGAREDQVPAFLRDLRLINANDASDEEVAAAVTDAVAAADEQPGR